MLLLLLHKKRQPPPPLILSTQDEPISAVNDHDSKIAVNCQVHEPDTSSAKEVVDAAVGSTTKEHISSVTGALAVAAADSKTTTEPIPLTVDDDGTYAPSFTQLMALTETASLSDIDDDVSKYIDPDKLLVYPFLGADRVELSAQGLTLCDFASSFQTDDLITLQLDASVGRNNIITLNKLDRNSLKPRTYVNDTIIEFWMLWISRNVRHTSSMVLFLSTHFYSEMKTHGIGNVSNWMQNRSVDVFSKKKYYYTH
jgi:hypothetical protein